MATTTPHCEEIQVFDGLAERTGNTAPLRGFRGRANLASSLSDLARRYRAHGDGIYYLVEGAWPADRESVNLKQPNWVSMTHTVEASEE